MTSDGPQHNFTGIWKLNCEKSIMRGAMPKQILMKIEHRERVLIQQILFTDANGTEHRQTFPLVAVRRWPDPHDGAS
jgi:hypothetical protein